MAEARKLAQRIAANPPHAVRMTKRLMREGRNVQLATLLELSAAMQSLAHATADQGGGGRLPRQAQAGFQGETSRWQDSAREGWRSSLARAAAWGASTR
jgi:hypothetical protein